MYVLNVASQSQQLFDAQRVEADDRLTLDHRDRCGQYAQVFEVLHGLFVCDDVSFNKRYAVLRKKLFQLAAKQSVRRRVNNDRLGAHRSLQRRQPIHMSNDTRAGVI